MKKLLLLIPFLLLEVFAYDPYQQINSQPDYMYKNDYTSVKLRESETATLNTESSELKQDALTQEQTAQIAQTMSVKTDANTNYFQSNFEYLDSALYCPPLSQDKQELYSIKLDSIDYAAGTVTCSVFKKPFALEKMSEDLKKVTSFADLQIVQTATFTNKKYLERLKAAEQDTANLIDTAAKEAAELYAKKIDNIKKTLNQKIAANTQATNNSVYLNLSQIIDAVMVFDQRVINIDASLAQGDIVLNPPYVQSYKAAHIREKVESNNKLIYEISAELNQKWDVLPVFFDPKSTDSIEQKKSDAYQVLGSGLNKILYFIVRYYEIINWSVYMFLFAAILFAIYNVSHYFLERAGNENERKNLKFKAITTIFTAIFLLFMTSTDTTYTSEDGLQVELSNMQGLVNVLSGETNFIANKLSEAIIDSHSGGMFSGSSFMTPREIERVAQEQKRKELIKEYQSNHMPRCYDQIDKELLKSLNPDAYKNSNFEFISTSSIKTAQNISPYNDVKNGGYLKNVDFNNQIYSFDYCSQLEKDYKLNLLKLDVSKKKIETFNDIELQDKNFEGKQAIMEKIWLNYQQYGYLSLPLIAVVDVYERVWELPHRKAEQYISLLTDFDMKESIKFVSENILFHYTIGGGVADWSASKYKIMTDGIIGWIPFVGQTFSNFGSSAMGFVTSILFVDTFVEFVSAFRNLFVFAISTIMLFLIFIAKFVVFWGTPFFIIYAFLAQSVEKTSRLIVKTILTFFKPVILIFVVFLTLFVMDFFHNMMYLFLDEMAQTMSGNGGYVETIIAYVLKNVGTIFAIMIEFLISFLMVVKGTNSIYAFFEQSSNDISDVVSDGIASTIQNKVVK